jgi:hypothetical protein
MECGSMNQETISDTKKQASSEKEGEINFIYKCGVSKDPFL